MDQLTPAQLESSASWGASAMSGGRAKHRVAGLLHCDESDFDAALAGIDMQRYLTRVIRQKIEP